MNKKKIIVLTVLSIVLIGFVVMIWVVGNQKTEWHASVEYYGPLNAMEPDSGYKNESEFTWSIDEYTDFQFIGQLSLSEGSVTLTYRIGDTIFSEETYGPGTYKIESPEYSGYNGEIITSYTATDDVQGSYDLFIYTRTTKLNKFLQKYDLK